MCWAAIQALVAHPSSANLVHRVIPQSGGHSAQRADTATAIAEFVIDQLGIKPGDIDTLQRVPWTELPKHYSALQNTDLGTPQIYLPVISEQMPVHPMDACEQGLGQNIDYLIGTCRDEMNLFDAFPGDTATARFQKRLVTALNAVKTDKQAVKQAYLNARPGLETDDVELAMMGDVWFRAPSVRIAETHATHSNAKTFMYLFAWESQFLGAAHAMDILVFGNGVPFGPLAGFRDSQEIANKIRKSWINFATNGEPSQPDFVWPSYGTDQRWTAVLDNKFSLEKNLFHEENTALAPLITGNWTELGI